MSVKDLKNGKYLIDFTDSMNKRHRIKVWGNKKTANTKEARLREQAEEEIMFPERKTQDVTYNQLSNYYFELHGNKLRSHTWQNMRKRLDKRFGNYTMKQLTSEVLQKYYNELRTKNKPATANRLMTLIKAVINYAIKHKQYCGVNPCMAVDTDPEDNKRTRYLSKAEIELLKKHCRPDVWRVVFCALCTGMRRGEILNLEWQNVDLVNDNITLLKTKSTKKREIPVLPELKTMLQSMKPKANGSVFGLTENAFVCSFRRTLKKLHIKNICFHDTRRTFASYFMINSGDIYVLQKLLGHSTVTLTERYSYLSPSRLKQGVQVVKNAFGSFN